MLFSRKEAFLQDFLIYCIISLKMFAGHIKVLHGPHVARGPDIAQACFRICHLNKHLVAGDQQIYLKYNLAKPILYFLIPKPSDILNANLD